MGQLDEAIAALRAFLAGFEPERVHGADAARLVELFSAGERLCAAGRTLAARRVGESNAWKADGARSAEDWLARRTGTSRAAAAATLDTGRRLHRLAATQEAFRAGRLSEAQVGEVAGAAAADPGSERELLAQAEKESLRGLQRSCRAVRAAADHEGTAARERIHQSRYLRHWTAGDGAVEGRFRLTADHGAVLLAALSVERERVFRRARTEARREPAEAYEADALVALARAAADGGKGGAVSSPSAVINVRVDRAALLRGHSEPGETCEIAGIGPVPVATVRRAAGDAILRAVLVDGDRVIDVRNAGRTIPHKLRVALEERDRTCAVPGCDAARHLEIHHLVWISDNGPTSLDNTCRICPWHHDQITHRGALLTGIPPDLHYHPPDRSPSAGGAGRAPARPDPPPPPPSAPDAVPEPNGATTLW